MISHKKRKRYLSNLRNLQKGFWKKPFVCFLSFGLLLAVILTQTHITLNQTPSLSYKVFLCINGLKLKKGDFISIHDHPTSYFKDIHYVKRLMGLPGDQIHLKNNQMYVEDVLIGSLQKTTNNGKPLHPLLIRRIPQGYVFVSADHPRSFDSRYEEFGLVKEKHIKGRCFGFFKSKGGAL